jgi:LuxR family maltose regulon positive regulatory protein
VASVSLDSCGGFWEAVAAAVPGATSRAALDGLGDPLLLVVDDFHLVRSREVAADLDRLVDRDDGDVSVLLVTRSDPPLRLERLRMSGRMSELRAADLAFTRAEAGDLLAGLDLSGEDVDALWRRTEGWVGGLRLAQLSLELAPDPHAFVEGFAGDDRAVSDYLMSEVVDQQPEATLDFLLRTCIVSQLTGELADALTEGHDGERVLRGLEREIGLVTATDDHGHWYRYHPLLLEVLRGESRRRLPALQPELHRRAARWHADAGSAVEAMRHAVAGGCWELAAEVAAERGCGPEVLSLCEQMPRGLNVEVRALTFVNLGISELWSGAGDAASEHLERAAGLALESGNDFLLFLAEGYAAAVDAQAGRLRSAAARAEMSIELAERCGWAAVPHAAAAYLARAAVHLWRGEPAEARRLTDRAAAAVAGSTDSMLGAGVSLMRAELLSLDGDPLTALDLVRGATAHEPASRLLRAAAGLLEADLRLALGEPDRARRALVELDPFDAAVGLARLELAEGDPAAAAAALAAFLDDEREPLMPFARVEACVLDAIAQDALRDEPAALAALERALDMAEPRGCSNVLLRYGAPLRSLLRRLLAAGTRHPALAEELLARLELGRGPEPVATAPLLEPLSERELTVLRYLPTMMSNAEIAAEMYVSVNTVKTHLKRVDRKLDVSDRRDCVRRGRELRLLSP